MNRIRTWLIKWLQGEAKSAPPPVDQQLRVDHPGSADGTAGPYTRVAQTRFAAHDDMPEPPASHEWLITYDGAGSLRVDLWPITGGSVTGHVARRTAPMTELSPATIVAMARDIMHWRTKF